MHGDGTHAISIYQLQQTGVGNMYYSHFSHPQAVLLKRLERVSATHLIWSPRGQYLVAAVLNSNVAGALHACCLSLFACYIQIRAGKATVLAQYDEYS